MKKLLTILLLLSTIVVHAQKLPDMGLYKVHVNEIDKNIQAEINPVESMPVAVTDRFYYWYSAGKIKITQGGYSGQLLNGLYNEFYLNKNLKEQGGFNSGLKNGIWKDWTENGILVQSITWKNGIKNGLFENYDESGNLKQQGNYTNGVLNGKQTTYFSRDSIKIVIYKNGKMVGQKRSKGFWHKLNPF